MYKDPNHVNRILDGIDKIRFEEARLLIDAGFDVIYDGDDVGARNHNDCFAVFMEEVSEVQI
mgnify:CR=1 FL=1